MERTVSHELNFKLWLLISQLSHSIILARQQELNQHEMPIRQYQILRIIQDQGFNATLSKVSLEAEREPNVISRITMRMEKDGLIKRTKIKPKSNLLRLELTQKGVDIVNASKESKSIDKIFSSLSSEEQKQLESILNKLIFSCK